MYAIFKDSGRQYRVARGETVEVDLKGRKPGETIEFGDVLVYHDGEKVRLGTPTVSGVRVVGEVVKDTKGPKIRVSTFIRREGYHRTVGHRQKHTLVKITDIVTA